MSTRVLRRLSHALFGTGPGLIAVALLGLLNVALAQFNLGRGETVPGMLGLLATAGLVVGIITQNRLLGQLREACRPSSGRPSEK